MLVRQDIEYHQHECFAACSYNKDDKKNKAKTTNNDHGGIGEILKRSSFGKILKGPRIRAAYPKIK